MIYFDAETLGELQKRFWGICHEKLSHRLPEEFIEWLQETDFFSAPASRCYHMDCEGGLLAHSLNVYDRLCDMVTAGDVLEGYYEETIAIVALFHDLCKINTYQPGFRNQKQPDGTWAKVPTYTFRKNDLPMGHGEKSVYLLLKHGVQLTDEEALAIRWHMGAYDNAVKGGSRDMNEALSKSALALAIQQADMRATYWDEG